MYRLVYCNFQNIKYLASKKGGASQASKSKTTAPEKLTQVIMKRFELLVQKLKVLKNTRVFQELGNPKARREYISRAQGRNRIPKEDQIL